MALNLRSNIKGAGDTRFILQTTAVLSLAMLMATWAGIRWLGLGLLWCWVVESALICALAIAYSARFRQGRWRTMRVIEPNQASDKNDRRNGT